MNIDFLFKTKEQIFIDVFEELAKEFDIYNILDDRSCFVIEQMITYQQITVFELLALSFEDLSHPKQGLGKKRAKKIVELQNMIRAKYGIV